MPTMTETTVEAVVTLPRKSSVPETGFRRPSTIDDVIQLADVASEILSNAMDHLDYLYQTEGFAAWKAAYYVMRPLHHELCAAHGFMCKADSVVGHWRDVATSQDINAGTTIRHFVEKVGSYIPDYRDEEGSDVRPEIERFKGQM